jgi:hypothetical protein
VTDKPIASPRAGYKYMFDMAPLGRAANPPGATAGKVEASDTKLSRKGQKDKLPHNGHRDAGIHGRLSKGPPISPELPAACAADRSGAQRYVFKLVLRCY